MPQPTLIKRILFVLLKDLGWIRMILNQEADPQAALQAAIAKPGPCLIHAMIDINEKVFPMWFPPGAAKYRDDRSLIYVTTITTYRTRTYCS